MPSTDSQLFKIKALISATVLIAWLYIGQSVFIPVALAVLVGFILSPITIRLERKGIPRTVAVLSVCLSALLLCGSAGWVLTNQMMELAEKLPQYRQQVEDKLQRLNFLAENKFLKSTRFITEIVEEPKNTSAPKENSEPENNVSAKSENSPTPVKIVAQPPNFVTFLSAIAGSLLAPVGKALMVVILAIFMLIERTELRDRLVRLAGTSQMNVTVQTLNEVGERVSRYLLTQAAVNVVFGVGIGIGLHFIGLPNPFVWGAMAAVLRFVPYLGLFIAVSIPLLLSMTMPSWYGPLSVVGLYAGIEILTYQIEPVICGSSAGLSPVVILLSALFWGALWGPIGLLLSTPLTVVLVVIGSHVPYLQFLQIALGDQPALAPAERLYQRMLALDWDESESLFLAYRKRHSALETYEDLLMPVLKQAKIDFTNGRIDDAQLKNIAEIMREMTNDVSATDLPAISKSKNASITVMCLAAKDENDELVQAMLANLLRDSTVNVENLSSSVLTSEACEVVGKKEIGIVCICAIAPYGFRHARLIQKRLKTRFPEIPCVILLWGSELSEEALKEMAQESKQSRVCNSFEKTVKSLEEFVQYESLRANSIKNTEKTLLIHTT